MFAPLDRFALPTGGAKDRIRKLRLFLEGGAAVTHNSPVPPDRSPAMFVADSKRLTHQGAKKIMATAVELAGQANIAISCAIVDAGGHVILIERMDGGRFHTVHSCTTKAVCA